MYFLVSDAKGGKCFEAISFRFLFQMTSMFQDNVFEETYFFLVRQYHVLSYALDKIVRNVQY